MMKTVPNTYFQNAFPIVWASEKRQLLAYLFDYYFLNVHTGTPSCKQAHNHKVTSKSL